MVCEIYENAGSYCPYKKNPACGKFEKTCCRYCPVIGSCNTVCNFVDPKTAVYASELTKLGIRMLGE